MSNPEFNRAFRHKMEILTDSATLLGHCRQKDVPPSFFKYLHLNITTKH